MIHEEAEDIEIEEFDPAIEASGEDTPEGKPYIGESSSVSLTRTWCFVSLGKALSVGKTKNRVLYATVSPPPPPCPISPALFFIAIRCLPT